MCTSVQEHPSARDRRTATWQMEILPLGATDVHPHSPPGIGLKIKECGKVGVDIVSGGILIFRYATSIAMMTLAKRERDESRQKKRSAKMKIGKTEIWRKWDLAKVRIRRMGSVTLCSAVSPLFCCFHLSMWKGDLSTTPISTPPTETCDENQTQKIRNRNRNMARGRVLTWGLYYSGLWFWMHLMHLDASDASDFVTTTSCTEHRSWMWGRTKTFLISLFDLSCPPFSLPVVVFCVYA